MERRVFLSYRRVNSAIVEAFEKELRRWSIDTWRDISLSHGDLLRLNLAAAIDHSDIVLLFLCPDAIRGLRSPRSGIREELDIWTMRRTLGTSRPNQKLVIVDLVGLTDGAIASIPSLEGQANALRLATGPALREAARERQQPSDADVQIVVREFVAQSIQALSLFPMASALLPGVAYESSWLGAGDGDSASSFPVWSQWEGRERPAIPLDNTGDRPMLRIDFAHRQGGWWMAVIGFGLLADGGWQTISVQPYTRLRIELKGETPDCALMIRARLEDSSQTGRGGSRHNSTSWSAPATQATDYFQRYDVDLRSGFRWDARSYRFNTASVDNRSILQVAIGQEPEEPPQAGVILIRQVLLLP